MRFLRPFNVAGKTKLLELTYMVTAALLLSTVVFATVFITHHFLLIKKYVIQEDAVEAILISILFLIAYFLSSLYKTEIRKYLLETRKLTRDKSDLSNKLIDAFKSKRRDRFYADQEGMRRPKMNLERIWRFLPERYWEL